MQARQHSARRIGRKRASTNRVRGSIADDVLFQPWFLPQRVAVSIHGLIPVDFRKKMRHFFDDYGCMICGTEVEYHSNGMCQSCHHRTHKRLLLSVKRHAQRGERRRLDLELFSQEKLAKKLLARFVLEGAATSKKPRLEPLRHSNPVYEALASRF
jgi:DNA-directed RNA polymerase subunit RPC12/RpoP